MSTDTAPAGTTPKPARLGSFVATQSPEHGPRTSPIPVVGADDTAFTGKAGIAHWQQVGSTPDATAEAEVKLAKLRHLSHPALAPVLESGLTTSVAWWIDAVPPGTPLADAVRNDASPASIPFVQRLVDGIAGVLELAHSVGLSQGAVERQSIVIG